MERFNVHSSNVDISVYSNLDYEISKSLQQQFLNYLQIVKLNYKTDYTVCLLKEKFGIDFDKQLNGYDIFISRNNRRIYTVIKKDDLQNNIIYIKRLIESLRNRILESKGAIFFHGASISIDDKAAIFLGNKNSGKTTTILNFLASGQAEYMSNDRVALLKEDGVIKVIGSPTNIGLRATTLEANNKLKGLIYNKINRKMQLDAESRIVLSVKQLRESLKIEEKSEAKLGWIFYIERAKDGITAIKQLSYNELIEKLKEQRINGVFEKNIILNDCIDVKNNTIENIIPENVKAYYFSQDGNCNQIFRKIFNQDLERGEID